MLIRRNTAKNGNLAPRAWNVLSSIPESISQHVAHHKRHPKSAYGTSLRAICEQWLTTFDRLDDLCKEHNWENKESSYSELLREYRELLYRLNEHLDACFSALRVLIPPDAGNGTIFDSQYLDKVKFPGWKSFKAAIAPYKQDHIGALVNSMKHNQGELTQIFFHTEMEFCPGYFLKDVLPGGKLGPSAKLHDGGETAFSFSRDMIMHFWWIYRIGELLAETTIGAVKALHNHDIAEAPQDNPDDKWQLLAARCAGLKPEFFPDEIQKPYPRILCRSDGSELSIEYPTSARGYAVPNMKISVSFKLDGAHPINKMPYHPK
jgi:hypothetical protein